MGMHMDQPGHAAHHCDGMTADDPDASDTAPSAKATSSENCPMNCCVQGRSHSASSSAATNLLPPLAVADKEFSFVPVKFTSAGFSSHTDRGPPAVAFLA
jgi:hypothetical protein